MFLQSCQKLFSCYAIIFVGLVESRDTSESEPSTFRVINLKKSHRQPCSHHYTTLKSGQLAGFHYRPFGAP